MRLSKSRDLRIGKSVGSPTEISTVAILFEVTLKVDLEIRVHPQSTCCARMNL